ncbi:MAG: CDP-diacylglycerol--glycerol-3-phosphate 3-phosphatidyltransferase [Candidatus Omnitrophica bacterium]|nr:CDP-diacylglycerol--glycerol-3-phosphate 3-phosphatidyltransferase [Candidatus Omnitrophota bacterium]
MNIANKVSIFRILSVPLFIACLIYYSEENDFLRYIALFIFMLAVFSDAVDGYLARKTKQRSPIGLVLDPLADKILLLSAFVGLRMIDNFPLRIRFPLWVSLIVVSRDIIILLGVIVIYLLRTKLDIYPTVWGKLTTFFQMLAVIAVLVQLSFSCIFWTVAVIFTLISGFDYIRRGLKLLYDSNHYE